MAGQAQLATKVTKTEKNLEAQVDELRTDIAKISETLKVMGTEKAQSLTADLKERATDLAARGRAEAEKIASSAGQVEAEVARQVRDKPLQSLAVAAIAGLLLGMLTRRN